MAAEAMPHEALINKMVIKYIYVHICTYFLDMLWPTWAGSGVGCGPHGKSAEWGGEPLKAAA